MSDSQTEAQIEESGQVGGGIAVPTQGIEALDTVIRGLYAKSPNPAKYTDLATQMQIRAPDASSALNVAKELGLAEVTKGQGRGAYVLTEPGKQYGLCLNTNNQSKRAALLREAITSKPRWSEVIVFLRSSVSQNRKSVDLSAHVASQLKRTWSAKALRDYGANYAGILEAAGLLTYERARGIITPLPLGDAQTTIEIKTSDGNGKSGGITPDVPVLPQNPTPIPAPKQIGISMPITINVTVDAKDADAIRAIIDLIKAARGEDSKPMSN
ncbi:MAG: hypothetical protein JRN03_06115 [Nitrososphaerota archaeon]|nr:hypothetical protein [Nitrososphaerota archaeon]